LLCGCWRNSKTRSTNSSLRPFFSGEVASALTKAERQKLIPVGDARPLLGRVMRTPPVMHPYESFLNRAVGLSSQTRSGLYDCLYVALAESEGCELVTDDQKLIANLASQFPFIVPRASLP
jgi:predicted nucleic acid-binding protein